MSLSARALAARVAPLILFVLFLLCYLATLTQVHTFDALSYVLDVANKPLGEVIHPHHVAYGPLGALSLWLARSLGYAGAPALPLQVANALAGALGVALFFGVVRRATGRADAALVAALALGCSYAFWYYAVEVEVYTVAVLFLICALSAMVDIKQRSQWGRWALLGAAQALATLFHQTNALLCVPVLLLWLLEPRRKLRDLLAYGATLAAGVGLGYGLAALLGGLASWGAFAAWMTSYARTGWWGGPITTMKWAGLSMGLAETVAQPWGAPLGLGLLALAMWCGRRGFGAGHGRLALAMGGWLLTYGAFFLWWEPDNIEFWIASLPPALLLLALALGRAKPWGAASWVGLALGASMLVINGGAIRFRGDAANDLQRQVAAAITQRSTPADLLLIPDGLQELYLQYYEGRPNILSLNQALYESAGSGQESWPAACAIVRGRIETALAGGAAVLLADEVLRPPETLLLRHHLRQQDVDDCLAPYRNDWTDVGMGPPLPAYVRIPTGQERAVGAGWDFRANSQGWRLANGNNATFAGGWRFVPNSDPNLVSPLLHVQSSEIVALEIRLANGTAARDAQLFYGDETGAMNDSRSVRWQLKAGPEPYTYRLELRGQPGWQGIITRLRIDPVGVGDGGSVQVDWIRLVR
jgi:hypothetical protein